MPKFVVKFTLIEWMEVDVEAEDAESAETMAQEDIGSLVDSARSFGVDYEDFTAYPEKEIYAARTSAKTTHDETYREA